MTLVQQYVPASVFSSIAYNMFHYLFAWSDGLWSEARKVKYFQMTPRPTSCKLVQHWGRSVTHGHLIPCDSARSSQTYDCRTIRCPVALMWGEKDRLVHGWQTAQQMQASSVDLRLALSIPGYEHLDLLWANTAPTLVYPNIVRLLEEVR